MTSFATWLVGVSAQMALTMFDEFGILAAILMSIIGMVLHWHQPRHRMSVEERVKDGVLTSEEGRRQIRFYSWCAPITTVIGIAVLLLVLFDMAG